MLSAAATVVRGATAIASAAVIAENSKNSYDEDNPPKAILIYKIKATTFHICFLRIQSLQLHTMLRLTFVSLCEAGVFS